MTEAAQRIVLVTGAAGGIGRALVELFSEDGDLVVATDLPGSSVAAVAEQFGTRNIAVEADVSNETDIAALFDRIDRQFGRLDVLVNNAAMGPTMAPTVDTPLDHFRRTLSVNLIGPFLMAREAARRMRPGGAIVNIASVVGIIGNPRRNAYSASKAGLISFTKSLACEWASRSIRVTSVAPGYVRTPMVAELEASGKLDLAVVRSRIPIGRLSRPDEQASAVRFLASPRARYITGAVLSIDGGYASFNLPGDAHPRSNGVPAAEVARPAADRTPRVVLVTGGANGIGAATARRFAALGDHVVIADREGDAAEALAQTLGDRHLAVRADVSSETEVAALFAAIADRYGRLDILVNNAAVADRFIPALEQDPQAMMALLDINLTGAFLVAREAVRAMKPGGMILNLGSINTFLPFAPRHAYGASKAGLDVLTRCMAAELGPAGIRLATIAPGYIRTPGVAELERTGRIDVQAVRRRIPLGDLGRPEDVAEAAAFLASSEACYVNGSILYVDGGWTAFGNAGFASSGEDAGPVH